MTDCLVRRFRRAALGLALAVPMLTAASAAHGQDGQGDALILEDPRPAGDRDGPIEGPIMLRDAEGNLTYTRQDQVTFPAFPKRENLIEIRRPTHASGRRYYLDTRSITLGQDRITRYTVIVRSSSGVNNVLYESLDCSERKVQVLGHGTGAGGFRATAGSSWRRYHNSGPMAYRAVLAEYYLCGESHEPLDAAMVVERLKINELPENPILPDRGDGGEVD